MNTQSGTYKFIKLKKLAIIGASQNRGKYGNIVYRNLRAKGYSVFAVNPKLNSVEGDRCYPNIASLPEPVEGIVTVVPPNITEIIVREAESAGITQIWMQEGSESEEAIRFCREHGMNIIYGQCVMVVSNYVSLMDESKP